MVVRRGLPLALLLVLWSLLTLGSRGVSLTMDEPLHIAVGYALLARGLDASWLLLVHGHPPLLNALEAWLVYAQQPNIPVERLIGWGESVLTYVDGVMPYLLPLERTEVLARTPVMLLTVALGSLVYRWGRRLQGVTAGVLALLLFGFDPLVLAHGRLATTDAGVTMFGTLFLYVCWRWYRTRRWRWSIAAGVTAGVVLLSKFSAALYVAAWPMVALVAIVGSVRAYPPTARGEAWRQVVVTLVHSLVTGLIALVLIWAVYGFTSGPVRGLPVALPLPAPVYWEASITQAMSASDRLFVAFGEQRFGTRWWYYPLNVLIKNPVPLLLVAFVGAYSYLLLSRRSRGWWLLLAFPVVYAAVAICAGMNVSYRHMLPVHPIMHVVAASALVAWRRRLYGSRRTKLHLLTGSRGFAATGGDQQKLGLVLRGALPLAGAAGLVFWYVLGTLGTFPNELTYFNELVGGAAGAPETLVDYTQDWGQGYKALRAYLASEWPSSEPRIFVFTPARPDHYGIAYRSLQQTTRFHPQMGLYVLGPAPMYGLNGPGREHFAWFRHADATAFIAQSLFVHHVDTVVDWLAQCSIPVVPLDEAAVAEGYGLRPARRVSFDCTVSWLYPGGNRQEAPVGHDEMVGAYALHGHLLRWERGMLSAIDKPVASDPFVARHLGALRLAYDQPTPAELPAFAIFERTGAAAAPPPRTELVAASINSVPRELMARERVSFAAFDGPLTLLDVMAYDGRPDVDVETWWCVTQAPIDGLFSVFVHAIDASGAPVAGADGFGVAGPELRVGDVVVQRHRLVLNEASGAEGEDLWLRVGAYWIDGAVPEGLVRWAVSEVPDADAVFLTLAESFERPW